MDYNIDQIVNLFRAKTKDQENYTLIAHVAETLNELNKFSKFIRDNVCIGRKSSLILGIMCSIDFIEDLVAGLVLHDIGKITYSFQKRLFRGDDEWVILGDFYNSVGLKREIRVRHEIISTLLSFLFLDGSKERYSKIRTSILLHHYNDFYIGEKIRFLNLIKKSGESSGDDIRFLFESIKKNFDIFKDLFISYLRGVRRLTNRLEIGKIIEKVIDEMINYLNHNGKNALNDIIEAITKGFASSRRFKLYKFNVTEEDLEPYYLILMGLLKRCDHSASANVPIEKSMNIGNLYNKLLDKLKIKIGKSLWQENLIRALSESDGGDHLILIAPTGSGKTEFGLLYGLKHNRKILYTLPLRTAINDIYMRLRAPKGYFGNDTVSILHSTAYSVYLKEFSNTNEINANMEYIEKALSEARQLSKPIIITTPDQVLLASLKYYGFDKILSIYPYSIIVLDEVQTYNEEMSAIIYLTLKMIDQMGGKFLILTATLPPYLKDLLMNEFNTKQNKVKLIDVAEIKNLNVKNLRIKRHRYKLLNGVLFNYNTKEKKIEMNEKQGQEILKILKENNSKNVFIVVNNVRKSIILYKYIRSKLPDRPTYLLHSRLIEREKFNKIEEIRKTMRKQKGVILVSTQIVEASINLDFDLMITEISSIDSQIQRWGRIYRNRERDYTNREPNIYIIIPESHSDHMTFDRGTISIYDKKVLEKTVKILKKHEGQLLSYLEERDMVKETFDEKIDGVPLREIYNKKIIELINNTKYFTVIKKQEAERLFRKLIGFQLVIPALMINSDNVVESTFGKLLIDEDNKIINMTWNQITSYLKRKLEQDGKVVSEVNKWILKDILNKYSIQTPIFLLKKLGNTILGYGIYNFKGYIVSKIPSDHEILKKLNKLGLDAVIEEEYDDYLNEFII